MFRSVILPNKISGKLYLHSMPGRYESFESAKKQAIGKGISRIICLAPLDEIKIKSPEYAKAIENDSIGWCLENFPITDYKTPDDKYTFLQFAKKIADFLISGENILIHCGAGIGRTGTMAIAVLMALGIPLRESFQITKDAGSRPETPPQNDLCSWLSKKLNMG